MVDTKEERQKRGKTSRASGKKFENDVRSDLVLRKWVVCKWTNTVIFDDNGDGTLLQAKSKYNPFLKRIISEGSGFPDFICFRRDKEINRLFNVIGVESKKAKYLDKKEKAIATWLLDNNIFSRIYIAHPIKQGRRKHIVYEPFER